MAEQVSDKVTFDKVRINDVIKIRGNFIPGKVIAKNEIRREITIKSRLWDTDVMMTNNISENELNRMDWIWQSK